MKNFFTELFGLLFIPVCLVGYYLTRHEAFLFVFEFVNWVSLLIYTFGTAVVVFLMQDTDTDTDRENLKKAVADLGAKMKLWRVLVSRTYWIVGTFYLLYEKAFYPATLMFIVSCFGTVTINYCRRVAKEEALKVKE